MQTVERVLVAFADFVWGTPLVVLLVGGGLFFLMFSRLLPYRYFHYGPLILSGRYDDPRADGDISHFGALSSALSGTLGLGNIAGVAVAIAIGGPGAVFWMWVSAVVGVATKFYTCSLAVMYRGPDSLGRLQGGPMYVIVHGLGRRWRPLAVLFSVAGLFGTLPVFQINQLVQILRDVVAVPSGWVTSEDPFGFNLAVGLTVAALVGAVIIGGIKRVGAVAGRLVPTMVLLYLAAVGYIMLQYYAEIPAALILIVTDAFTGQAAAGGAIGAVILTGIRRGAFSNEAGIGTEAMAHGAAKTGEPIREGLVAMLGPVVDTLIVCTCTALAILLTGVWQGAAASGITLTANAFELAMPGLGGYLLVTLVAFLSISTMITFWYYGAKCLGFLIGAEHQHWYRYFYTALIVVGAIGSLDAVIALIDGMYALMAIPTMTSALLLAPRVNTAARDYLARLGPVRRFIPEDRV